MSRNPENLEVFHLADALVAQVYRWTQGFPPEERYGLQSQLRRAAVSIATNIVEGCSRTSTKDYLRFMEIARGSAQEVKYLLGLSRRLGFLAEDSQATLELANRVAKALQGLQAALSTVALSPEARSPKPEAP